MKILVERAIDIKYPRTPATEQLIKTIQLTYSTQAGDSFLVSTGLSLKQSVKMTPADSWCYGLQNRLERQISNVS